ncbi:MAG: carboxypeptidase-like regulatory domain-containing protein [Thermoguttaceae bacterium]
MMVNLLDYLRGTRKLWLGLLVLAVGLPLTAWLVVTHYRRSSSPAPSASSKAGASYLNLLLGCVPVKGVAESGFSYQEKNGLVPFRWTDGAAKLLVPVDAEHPPQRLWVSIGIYRPEPASVPCHVLVDGISLYEGPVPIGRWAINLDLSSHSFSEQAAIELQSGTFLPKGRMSGGTYTDPRTLGVQVNGVMLERDDVGPPDADKGLTLRGRALDQQGKPVAGMVVGARISPAFARKLHAQKPAGTPLPQDVPSLALTSEQGEFRMGPLPAGDYEVRPRNDCGDTLIEGRKPCPPPDLFLPQEVTLPQASAQAVEIRGVPSVTVEVQFTDPAGKPVPRFALGLTGVQGGKPFWTDERPQGNGHVVLRAPKGLERAALQTPSGENTACRCRTSKSAPLSNRTPVELGTLTADVRDITIVCYRVPVLLVRALTEDGEPIRDFKPRVDYPPGKAPFEHEMYFAGGARGSVVFQKQDDGRWRSRYFLLPDEPFTLTIEAPGYKPRSGKLSLPEGAVKELDVKLKPQ